MCILMSHTLSLYLYSRGEVIVSEDILNPFVLITDLDDICLLADLLVILTRSVLALVTYPLGLRRVLLVEAGLRRLPLLLPHLTDNIGPGLRCSRCPHCPRRPRLSQCLLYLRSVATMIGF